MARVLPRSLNLNLLRRASTASAAAPNFGWIGPGAMPAARKAAQDAMLRVDHAGEVGAVEIYRGQSWVLRHDAALRPLLKEMQAGEETHVKALEALLAARRARPSALTPLWRAAGFALGVASAAAGPRVAMAVTVAVETAISAHYNAQVRDVLAGGAGAGAGADAGAGAGASAGAAAGVTAADAELVSVFARHRDEEVAHHDTAVAHGARDAPGFAAISAVVQAGCAVAIAVATRV